MSGKRTDRPSYQAMLEDVRRLRKKGQNVVVIVKWLHRLGRPVLERARAWEELDELDVSVHSVAEGGQVPKLVADVLAAVAEEESRQICERVAGTWRHVTSQGWAKTGRVAWGYKLRPATPDERAGGSPKSVLEVDPETGPLVVEAFERLAAGQSGRRIAHWAANLPESARAGKRLSRRTLDDMWRSPVYVARPIYGAAAVLDRPRARWPQLVDDSVWQRVQDRLDSHRRLPRQASGRFLLTGFLKCPQCGGRMVGQSANRSMPKPRYRCASDAKGILCTQTADLERVDKLVLQRAAAVVGAVATDNGVQHALGKAWKERQQRTGDDQERKVSQFDAVIEKSRARIKRGTELFVDGALDREAYDDLVNKARSDMAAAEQQLLSITQTPIRSRVTLPPLRDVLAAAGGWTTILQGAELSAQRDILAALVDHVIPVRERAGVYRPDIGWTRLGAQLATPSEGASDS